MLRFSEDKAIYHEVVAAQFSIAKLRYASFSTFILKQMLLQYQFEIKSMKMAHSKCLSNIPSRASVTTFKNSLES